MTGTSVRVNPGSSPPSAVDVGLDSGARLAAHTTALREWISAHSADLGAYRFRQPRSLAAAVEHDRGLLRLLHDAGWTRWGWSKASGGLGGPIVLRAVLYDELAAADVELPEAFVILETLGPVLDEFAPALAARHLNSYLSGQEMWGQGFSEPEAGSDLAHLRTRAAAVGQGFVLDGQKTWMTLGQFAQYSAVLARTGSPDSAHRGLTMLWVDLRAPGVTVRPITASNGRDEFAEVYFDGVVVPSSAVIGAVGRGWDVAMFLLQYERGMYAWMRQAVLHRRLRAMTVGASVSGTPSAAFAALGSAALAVAGLRARSAQTVRALSDHLNPGPDISIDKVLLSTAEQAVFDAARQLQPVGFALADSDAAQVWREEWFYSRASSIFGGAVDVQRDIIARLVLGLPRESR
jgi:acyl-CoA dehydrogenase